MGGHGPAIPDDSPGCDAEVHQHAAGTAVSMHRWAALCGMPAPAGGRHPYFHPGQAPENRHACKEPLPPSQSVLNKLTDVNEHWRLGVVRPACTHPSHNRYPALKVQRYTFYIDILSSIPKSTDLSAHHTLSAPGRGRLN